MRIHRLVSTLAVLALVLLLLVAVGCGGDDDGSASETVATETSGGSDTTASETGSIPEGYSGVEAELPTAYETPEMQDGTSCKIGFQNPVAANEFLGFVQKAVIAQAKAVRLHRRRSRRRAQPGQAGLEHAAAARPGRRRDHLLSPRP